MPRITVLMPTYNVAPWVKDAIESVLNQTYTDFELMVLDDCSTDNTLEVVRSIHDDRIRIVEGNCNIGLADNLNRGLELAETELLARMDGDDIAESTWLETGVGILDERPEIGICSFGFQFFGTKNSIVRFPEKNEDSMAQMLFGCTVIVPVFRRSVMIDNGLRYKTSTFPAEDYRMWAECYRVTKVYNVQETMFHYRMHTTQISTAKRESQIEKSNEVRIYMLDWLNPNLSKEDQEFFINQFVDCKIRSRCDLRKMRTFAEDIILQNTAGHYTNAALRRRFQFQIAYAALDYVESAYFEQGYSLMQYLKLLFSGMYGAIPQKHKAKLLVKSLLRKKK